MEVLVDFVDALLLVEDLALLALEVAVLVALDFLVAVDVLLFAVAVFALLFAVDFFAAVLVAGASSATGSATTCCGLLSSS